MENQNPTAGAESTYHPIPLEVLRLDLATGFDLHIRPKGKARHVLYREEHLPFSAADRQRLLDSGVAELYVSAKQLRAYRRYLEDNLSTIVEDPKVAPEVKAELIYGSLVSIVDDVTHDPRAGDAVVRSRQVVDNTCSFLYKQHGSLEYMMRVCSFDYYTYTHSVNVFVFAMALGQHVFDEELVNGPFGMGALLHDVGKYKVSNSILNCKGKLSAKQFEEMKRHTVLGFDVLKERGDVPALVFDMVRHHHERLDGNGYPDGLEASQIRKEVRVLTIADVFDALTTQRSYKRSMDSFPALKLMSQEMEGHLDPELFREFVRLLGKAG